MGANSLSNLSARSCSQPCDTIDKLIELREFEKIIGSRLPEMYTSELLCYGTDICFDGDVRFRPIQKSPWDRKDGSQSLEVLYGLTGSNSLLRQHKVYGSRLPSTVIPIGESPGGNIICLGMKGETTGKVYLWDHENEREITGELRNDFGNMYLISESLEGFIKSLVLEREEQEKKPDGIVEAWLADDL